MLTIPLVLSSASIIDFVSLDELQPAGVEQSRHHGHGDRADEPRDRPAEIPPIGIGNFGRRDDLDSSPLREWADEPSLGLDGCDTRCELNCDEKYDDGGEHGEAYRKRRKSR